MAALNSFSILRYRVVPPSDDYVVYGATDLAVPVIDDVPLFERLGGWPGIPFEWLQRSPNQWLGSPSFTVFGSPVVLDGSCGEAECCGIAARITITDDTIVWDGIRSLNETYPLRFEFDRSDYEAQIRGLPDLVAIEWNLTDEWA